MKRILPSPALSVALFVLWVLLVQSMSPGNVLLGLGLALFWPAVTGRIENSPSRARRPTVMAKLFVRVVGDMLKSNAELAWVLLTRRASEVGSRFVFIPLDLEDPGGLSALATIVTFTPGTAWVELSVDKRTLLIHVFSARDEASVVAEIKGRYEQLLREIFE
jgi:multicomponent K+:H+ antiporter subunit E